MSQTLRRRAARFLFAGVPITLCDYATFKCLVLTGLEPSWARAAAFGAAFTLAFLLHRRWTFGSVSPWPRDLLAYAPARAASFLLAQLVFMVLQKDIGFTPDLAFWLQAPVQPISNFLLGHYLVFGHSSETSS